MAKAKGKIELKVIIHDTDASLRFGGDGYKLTFAGTEEDLPEAMALSMLKKTRLKLTIEIDDERESDTQKRGWP